MTWIVVPTACGESGAADGDGALAADPSGAVGAVE